MDPHAPTLDAIAACAEHFGMVTKSADPKRRVEHGGEYKFATTYVALGPDDFADEAHIVERSRSYPHQ